jgi:hypothetical protein
MESRFGHDFSRVRVHTDRRAAESARELNALAYTVGPNIVFAAGEYVSHSRAGRHLVAHELAHSIQQSKAPAFEDYSAAGLRIGNPTDNSELYAEQTAERVLSGSSFAPSFVSGPVLQCYGDPIPTVANPSVVTMAQFIDLIKRIEAANPGMTSLQISQMIMRTKYHSQAWDYLLPSSAAGKQVGAGKGVTSADVTTLAGEFEVSLPQGGQSDPSHVVTAIVAAAEIQTPGAGGAGGWSGKLIGSLPQGLSQRDVTTWAGDVASAAAEWKTAHPHPKGGVTKQAYMDEYAPESDLIADIDGLAIASKKGFAFNPLAPLSTNLDAFYFPIGGRDGKNRRFHNFCAFEGLDLTMDGITLGAGAVANIDNRVRLNTEWFERNDPNLTAWMALQGNALFNPVVTAWRERANDWQWFAEKFRSFLQRNLKAEGA